MNPGLVTGAGTTRLRAHAWSSFEFSQPNTHTSASVDGGRKVHYTCALCAACVRGAKMHELRADFRVHVKQLQP